ncbi:MAG: biopolymer transporter ExbD [Flavobacteriales bacterium]|jgi:biopolymer transport protein ExbD|nr:biopolymer transporter ExbD [Flavobacteriales bacterium]
MAQVPEGGGDGGGGKRRAKRGSTHIDMTPMVDLAFLLLTFFILTTTMYRPSTLQLTFPVPPENPDEAKETELSNAVTLLLTGDDRIFYYLGEFRTEPDPATGRPATELAETNFSDVRKLLADRNVETIAQLNDLARRFNDKQISEEEYTASRNAIKGDKDNLKAIIKTDPDAKYRNMIDMVDEMDIVGIGSYGVLDSLRTDEQALLDAAKANL